MIFTVRTLNFYAGCTKYILNGNIRIVFWAIARVHFTNQINKPKQKYMNKIILNVIMLSKNQEMAIMIRMR